MNMVLLFFLTFSPLKDSLYWVDSVIVVSSRDTQSTSAICVDEIEISNFRTDLRGAPSVLLRDFGGKISPSVRGLDDKETQIYLDGVKVNSPIWGFTPLNIFPEAFLSKATLIKDGVSLGGDFPLIGGVFLNLKKNERLFRTDLGSFGKRGVSMVLGNGDLSGGIHISKELNDFPYQDRFKRDYIRKDNDQGLLSAYFLKEGNMRILAFLSDLKMGLPRRGYGQEGNDREGYRDFILNLGEGGLHFSSYTEEYTFSPSGAERERYISGRLALGFKKNTLGVGSKILWMQNKILGRRYSFSLYPSFHYSLMRNGKKLEFLTRVEGNIREGKPHVFPYIFLGFFQRLRADVSFYASLKISAMPPNFSELFWKNTGLAEGNPNLRGERSVGGDLGLRIARLGSSEFVLFYDRVKDAIFWRPQESVWRPQNLSHIRLYGFEARHRIAIGSLSLREWITFLINSVDKNRVLPYRPKIWGREEISWRGISLRLSLMGERPTYFSEESAHLPSIHLVDFSIKRTFSLKERIFLTVDFEVNNLLNESYEIISGYPMPGRNFNFSCTFRR